MFILSITPPGIAIDYSHPKLDEIKALLSCMEDHFYEANVALNEFLIADQEYNERFAVPPSQHLKDIEKRKAELHRKYDNHPAFENKTPEVIEEFIDGIIKDEQWRKYKGPDRFLNIRVILNAKSFIYALDGFEKCLKKMNDIDENENRIEIHGKFKIHFPEVLAVRDSAHHLEDRVRRKTREKKIDTDVLMLNGLIGNNFLMTKSDGNLGNVNISQESLRALKGIFDEVLNSFSWHGLGLGRSSI